jgi:hypothetical protein
MAAMTTTIIKRHGVSVPLSAAPYSLRRLWEICSAQLEITKDAAAKRDLRAHMGKLADEIIVAAAPTLLLAAAARVTLGAGR